MNEREEKILAVIKQKNEASISDILEFFAGTVTRITVFRDIDKLLNVGKILRIGNGRSTVYKAAVDLDEYFLVEPDKRKLKSEYYNFDVWRELDGVFSPAELTELSATNRLYLKNRARLSPTALKKELQRLSIEFSWKSSQIEGNTYSLLDTERLLTDSIEAADKKRDEAVMIINHKKALDFIFADPQYFSFLTVAKIEDLHSLVTEGLNVKSGVRNHRVGITGTAYRPLDNGFKIREELKKLAETINKITNPIEKAFLAVLMISYIQPFEDGNKRTARLLGNALLLAGDYCPLSYRSVDEVEYKKAVVFFYEQNNCRFFKQVFAAQFKQAVEKYF